MSVAVTVRAEVAAHLRLDVPVMHLHVHYLHEFDSRGQLLNLLLIRRNFGWGKKKLKLPIRSSS